MPDKTKPQILYVEDEPLILDLGVIALKDAGYIVAAVSSAKDAAAALEKKGAKFKALITDVDLGSKENGWSVARRARELFADMPVVYVSGGSSHDWTAQGVPGSILVSKPYADAELVVAVQTRSLAQQANVLPEEFGRKALASASMVERNNATGGLHIDANLSGSNR